MILLDFFHSHTLAETWFLMSLLNHLLDWPSDKGWLHTAACCLSLRTDEYGALPPPTWSQGQLHYSAWVRLSTLFLNNSLTNRWIILSVIATVIYWITCYIHFMFSFTINLRSFDQLTVSVVRDCQHIRGLMTGGKPKCSANECSRLTDFCPWLYHLLPSYMVWNTLICFKACFR